MSKRLKEFPKKRKFNGKDFSLFSYHFEKKSAQESAKRLRKQGCKARVVFYPLEPRGADRHIVYRKCPVGALFR